MTRPPDLPPHDLPPRDPAIPDPDDDLVALLQGHLDPGQASALAGWLNDRPADVARALDDARLTADLRDAMPLATDPAPAALLTAAKGLQDQLNRQAIWRRIAPLAAGVVLFIAGWVGHDAWQTGSGTTAPPLVKAALDAQAALDLRHWMVSQPESVILNPQEIVAALGIDLPDLPATWIIRDVQIVATPDRPGLAIALDAPDLGRIMLLAVARDSDTAARAPTVFDYDGQTFAQFDRGRAAFVLVDEIGYPDQLARSAGQLMAPDI